MRKCAVDRGKTLNALLADLSKSKAFDCLDHELLIAKLKAYGFSLPSLNLFITFYTTKETKNQWKQYLQLLVKNYFLMYCKAQFSDHFLTSSYFRFFFFFFFFFNFFFFFFFFFIFFIFHFKRCRYC